MLASSVALSLVVVLFYQKLATNGYSCCLIADALRQELTLPAATKQMHSLLFRHAEFEPAYL